MGNAVWLFFALPVWYFSTITAPFGSGVLSAIPVLGIVSLVLGVVWGVIIRRLGLMIFLLLPAASQALMVVAGFMRGSPTYSLPILSTFLLLQIAFAGYFVVRLKGARLPAAVLTIFTASYAFFAAFVATMAFSDTWL